MILPFERNFSYLTNFKGRFIPSLVNDLSRFEKIQSGFLMCVSENMTGYVVFREGKTVSINGFYNCAGNEWPAFNSFIPFLTSSNLDVYSFVIEDTGMIENVITLLSSPSVLMVPFELADIKRITGMIEAEKETGAVCFKNGTIINMAVYNKGCFEKFYYYHPGTKSYAADSSATTFESYLSSFQALKPFVVYKRKIDKNESIRIAGDDFFPLAEPLSVMIEFYAGLFEVAYRHLKEKLGESKVAEITNQLLNVLRQKYSPLYSTIGYSKEKGRVNWESLLDERKFISNEYRFDKYHLYLDELLRMILKMSQSVFGDKMESTVIVSIKKRLEFIDKKDPFIKEMAGRVDKMVEKVK